MTTAEVLRAAKRLIPDEDAWLQTGVYRHGGGVCLVGALCKAVGLPRVCPSFLHPENDPPELRAALMALKVVIPGLDPSEQMAVEWWNDAEGRTLAEVHNALDRAAMLCDSLAEAEQHRERVFARMDRRDALREAVAA